MKRNWPASRGTPKSANSGLANIVAIVAQREQTMAQMDPAIRRATNPTTSGKMRSGSGQQPRGRFNANRPPRQPPRAPQNNQSFDSNGPNIKIRGSALQIFERYVALAREAAIGDDRVAAENFYQHAEHYFRITNANREGNQQGTPPRPTTPADVEMNSSEPDRSEPDPKGEEPADHPQPRWNDDDPGSSETSLR
jgi:Domain of unknown function (DUF4167)